MALVRILVDGYSLLHAWPDLARGKARHSAAAREELIHILTRYQDAIGTPITIFFDGSGAPSGTPKPESNPSLEVIYSPAGRTADDLIERSAHLFRPYGEVLVVTNDSLERDTVTTLGGYSSLCAHFIKDVQILLKEETGLLAHYNRRENERFKRGG